MAALLKTLRYHVPELGNLFFRPALYTTIAKQVATVAAIIVATTNIAAGAVLTSAVWRGASGL